MSAAQQRRVIFITILAVAAVLVLIIAWLLWKPAPASDTSGVATTIHPDNTQNSNQASTKPKNPPSAEKGQAPDPSTVSTLAISQLGIALTYDKSLPGIAYSIELTGAGTQYVELTDASLAGSTCTDDDGVFATIMKNPNSQDNATVTSTVKVGGETYGLSLPTASCTGNPTLFAQYQASMKANFPYLTAATSAE